MNDNDSKEETEAETKILKRSEAITLRNQDGVKPK